MPEAAGHFRSSSSAKGFCSSPTRSGTSSTSVSRWRKLLAQAGGGGGTGLAAGAVRGKASGRRFSLDSRANGAAQPQPDARGLCAMGSVATLSSGKTGHCPSLHDQVRGVRRASGQACRHARRGKRGNGHGVCLQ